MKYIPVIISIVSFFIGLFTYGKAENICDFALRHPILWPGASLFGKKYGVIQTKLAAVVIFIMSFICLFEFFKEIGFL